MCLAGLALTDKIAFAARFLSDRQLADYLEREWLTLLAAGSIQVSSHQEKKIIESRTGITNKNKIVKDKKWIRIRRLSSVTLRRQKKIYFMFFLISYPQASVLEI